MVRRGEVRCGVEWCGGRTVLTVMDQQEESILSVDSAALFAVKLEWIITETTFTETQLLKGNSLLVSISFSRVQHLLSSSSLPY